MKIIDLITKLQKENPQAEIVLAIGISKDEKDKAKLELNKETPVYMRRDKIEVISPARPITDIYEVIISANFP